MITEYDDRVYKESEFMNDFYKAVEKAMNYIREHFMDYARPGSPGYENEFSPYTIRDAFDEQIMKYGFEIDGRSIRHAYGIGNNNEWDIVDKNINKVGNFYATNDMHSGVMLGVEVKGEVIDRFHICTGGFIRED